MKKILVNCGIAFGIIAAIDMMSNEDIGFSNVAGLILFFGCLYILNEKESTKCGL